MMRFDIRVGVPGNAIAAGSRDGILLAFEQHFAVNCQSLC